MAAEQGAPEYWKQFVDELRVQAENLEKKFTRAIDENIEGKCIPEEPTAMKPDHSCTIIVTRHSVVFDPEVCQFFFYYRPGSTQIKKSELGQSDVLINLRRGSQGIVADVNGSSMTAKQLAVYIVKGMYERVKFPQ